ncbi:LacI family DNA-binding transcriptional regulator [candidate division KSB1 bacterium]|nr:LacI family DNA-binding transcriptional regulator [candidate division KSB1 bacterium]
MPVTIYDVAKKAGVGIGTVSRAINNSAQINPATKAHVLKIIKELHYQPHALAQSLARKKTFTIASVVPFFTNYFFVELLKSVQAALSNNNYDLILYSINRMDRRDTTLDRVLTERRADGVLIFSLGVSDEYAEKFIDSQIPVVIVDHMHPQIDSIVIANREGAYLATQHLIQVGHEQIGMIDGHLSSYPAILRLEGFKQALQENHLTFYDQWLEICDARVGEHGFNEAAGYKAMKRLLSRNSRLPTALFVASDVQALGVMRAAKEAGLRIPDDIALVGFDDIELAKFVGLSTMHQPIAQMGQMAVDHLLQRIQGVHHNGFYTELKAKLIVRESCGAKQAFRVQVE